MRCWIASFLAKVKKKAHTPRLTVSQVRLALESLEPRHGPGSLFVGFDDPLGPALTDLQGDSGAGLLSTDPTDPWPYSGAAPTYQWEGAPPAGGNEAIVSSATGGGEPAETTIGQGSSEPGWESSALLVGATWSWGSDGSGDDEGSSAVATTSSFAPSPGTSGDPAPSPTASGEPPPTGTPYLTGRAAAVQPGPLLASAFETSPFQLQSGSAISAAATFSIDSGFDPGQLSGGDTVTTTGTDAGGIGFTTVNTYSYEFTVSSTMTEGGAWTYEESYTYQFDTTTTPTGPGGEASHNWGTTGYTFTASGSAAGSSFTLTVFLSDHLTRSWTTTSTADGVDSQMGWESAADREVFRTVTGQTDLGTGQVKGTDSGWGEVDGALSSSGVYNRLLGEGFTGTVSGILTGGGQWHDSYSFSAEYEGNTSGAGNWTGTWSSDSDESGWQEHEGSASYTHDVGSPALQPLSGTYTESGRDDYSYQHQVNRTLNAEGAWRLISGSGDGTARGASNSSSIEGGGYSYQIDDGALASNWVSGTETLGQNDQSTYSAAMTSILNPLDGTWATSGTLDTTSSARAWSSYTGSAGYDYSWTGARATFGPEGLRVEGLPQYRRQGTLSESGRADVSTTSQVRSTLAQDGTWVAVSGSGSLRSSGYDQIGLAGTVSYGHPVGQGVWLSGTETESQVDGSSYAMETTASLVPADGTWATCGGSLDTALTGTSSYSYEGESGQYDYSWWGEPGTFGPSGLEANGSPWYRRRGTTNESGRADSSYRIDVHHVLNLADQSWAAVGGTGSSANSEEARVGLSGTITYEHPLGAGAKLTGTTTESQEDGVSYTGQTESILGADGAWATTGSLDTASFGFASSSYVGSGNFSQSWTEYGTYGPDGLQATNWSHFSRAGTATESGRADSSYRYQVHNTLELDGDWVVVGGTGIASATGEDREGLSATLTYDRPLAGGTLYGSRSESQDDGTSYVMESTAILNPADGTWSRSGSLDVTSSGSVLSSYTASGTYLKTWGEYGTYGPDGLQATNWSHFRRAGTATENGHVEGAYEYLIYKTLTAAGTWAVAGGSGTASATGEDREGLTGTLTYDRPLAGGTLYGTKTESQDDGATYTMSIAATLNPADGTWARSGSLDVTSSGSVLSSYTASGTYLKTWGEYGTYGPDGLQATNWSHFRRAGTATESGRAGSSYSYLVHNTLTAADTWAVTGGSGTASGSGEDRRGFVGTLTYDRPLAGGTLYGSKSESQDDGVEYTMESTATLNPATGTWAISGTLLDVATGSASSSYSGSGTYLKSWGELGISGPAGLQVNNWSHFRRAGTATESGHAESSYRVEQQSVLNPDRTWRKVSGGGTGTATGESRTGYSGTNTYDRPLPWGILRGTETEARDDGVTWTLGTTLTLTAAATWTAASTLDTVATGSASSSYSGSGTYSLSAAELSTVGPVGLQANNWSHLTRTGTVTESGSATSSYRYEARDTQAPGGAWQAAGGTGTSSASRSDSLGFSGTFTYDHPLAGGTLRGSGTESQNDRVTYTAQISAARTPAGDWSTTGTMAITGEGATAIAYSGSGSYSHSVGGRTLSGTATESGDDSSSYLLQSTSTLQSDGTWKLTGGTLDSTGSGRMVAAYGTTTTFAISGSAYFDGMGTSAGTGRITEEWSEEWTTSLDNHYAAGQDGLWRNVSGGLVREGEGSGTIDYEAHGSYSEGSWLVSQHNDINFSSVVTTALVAGAVVGAAGATVTAGRSDTSVNGSGDSAYAGSSSSSTGGGAGANWSMSSSSDSFSSHWTYDYDDGWVLAADGSVSALTTYEMNSSGSGGGSASSSSHSSSSSSTGSTTTDTTSTSSWSVGMSDRETWREETVTATGADGQRRKTGTASGSSSSGGGASFSSSSTTSTVTQSWGEGGQHTWTSHNESNGGGGDSFATSTTWSRMYNPDGTTTSTTTSSGNGSGSKADAWVSSWTHSWTDQYGNSGSESGGDSGSSSASYDQPQTARRFAQGWYTGALAGPVQTAGLVQVVAPTAGPVAPVPTPAPSSPSGEPPRGQPGSRERGNWTAWKAGPAAREYAANFAEFGGAVWAGLRIGANNVGEAVRGATKKAIIDPAVTFGKGARQLVTDPVAFGQTAKRAGTKLAQSAANCKARFDDGWVQVKRDPAAAAKKFGDKMAAGTQVLGDEFMKDPSKGFAKVGAEIFVAAGTMATGKFAGEVTAPTPEGAALRRRIGNAIGDFVADARGSVPLPGGGTPKSASELMGSLSDNGFGKPYGTPAPKKGSLPDHLKERFNKGKDFDRANRGRYPHNEVEVEVGGKKYVVDSYDPRKEIVSRKGSQLADIKEKSAIEYLNEFQRKYSAGAEITDSPFNPKVLRGDRLSGQLILEVPVQTKPIPQAVLDAARTKGITIRDINGKVYN